MNTSSHIPAAGTSTQQQAGSLLSAPFVGVPVMSSKKKKSMEYWKNKKLEQKRGEVERPQENPKFIKYFLFKRQGNMNLRKNPDGTEAMIDEDGDEMELTNVKVNWAPLRDLSKDSGVNLTIPLILVNEENGFNEMMQDLMRCTEIAVDLEGNNDDSFFGMVCILQVSTWEKDYIIDVFPLHEKICNDLESIFMESEILKIMHGGENDIIALRRDFGLSLTSVLDTTILEKIKCSQNVNQPNPGLLSLVKKYLKNDMGNENDSKKMFQQADWRRRPIPNDMIQYARKDSHYLLRVWNQMKKEISEHLYEKALINTATKIINKSYKKRQHPTAHQELSVYHKQKGVNPLPEQCYQKFEILHYWRNRYAAITDNRPENIMPASMLIKICLDHPNTTESLVQTLGRISLPLTQIHTILRILREGEKFTTGWNRVKCHNCLKAGHIAAQCPFPKDPKRFQKYTEDHKDEKTNQNRRRRQNKMKNKRAKAETKNLDK